MDETGTGIRTTAHGDVTVVGLLGEHDVTSAAAVREQLSRIATSGGGLVVSMMQTTFFDSSIVHALFDVDREMRDHDRQLVLHVATAPIVRRVLDISMLSEAVPCTSSLTEAVEIAGGRAGTVEGLEA